MAAKSAVGRAVERFSADCLRTYEVDERRVVEDANLEREAIAGGYARPAVRADPERRRRADRSTRASRGRPDGPALYCANQGSEVTEAGVGALLGSHNSPKTGVEIGRFGLGFKSVLGVSDEPGDLLPERQLRLRWCTQPRARSPHPTECRTCCRAQTCGTPSTRALAARADFVLASLMRWASTVVVVPRNRGDSSWLGKSIREFPRQFSCCSPPTCPSWCWRTAPRRRIPTRDRA